MKHESCTEQIVLRMPPALRDQIERAASDERRPTRRTGAGATSELLNQVRQRVDLVERPKLQQPPLRVAPHPINLRRLKNRLPHLP